MVRGIRSGCTCRKHHPEKIGREYPPVIKGQHMLKSINSLHLRRSRITITASMFNVDEEPHKDILSPHSVLFDRLSRFTE